MVVLGVVYIFKLSSFLATPHIKQWMCQKLETINMNEKNEGRRGGGGRYVGKHKHQKSNRQL